MSGIYIPNMDADNFRKILHEKGLEFIYISVPPHGDLIDRNVLEAFGKIVSTPVPGGKLTREYVTMAVVRAAKTIIPADKGNER